MGYLIDSDWVVDHRANEEAANRLLSRLSEEGIAISVITYIEIYQGVLRSPTPQVQNGNFRRLLIRFRCCPSRQRLRDGVPTLGRL
jgi:predicted nucleic acid-binding protein